MGTKTRSKKKKRNPTPKCGERRDEVMAQEVPKKRNDDHRDDRTMKTCPEEGTSVEPRTTLPAVIAWILDVEDTGVETAV